ncbi:MAG: MMPL family transporter, partial [Deltaproteobacteria bacterium]|nr:MMPL family transporter [Deltaproteobacteria bacterium]
MSTSDHNQAAAEPVAQQGSRGFPIAPRWLVVALLVVVAGLAGFAASRVRVVEDISALFPQREGRASVIELARQAGLMRRVAIVIGPDSPGADRLHLGADAVARGVAALDGIGGVVSAIDPEQTKRAAELLMERAMRLHRGAPLENDEIRARLTALKERLASPEALVMQRYLLADPLGFSREALRGVEGAARSIGGRVDRGRLMSADRRYSLVFAEVAFDPLEVERSSGFVDQLDVRVRDSLVEVDLGDLEFVALGGPHFVVASSGTMIRDIRLAFAITAVGVLLVFVFFLGRLRLLPVALLPGGIGIGVALGVMGLVDTEIHALTIGFAAAVTGISVDYAIHLFHRALHRAEDSTGGRIAGALAAVWRPVVLGCATTVVAFVIVSFTGFPGVRQLAIFSSISVPVALIATLFLLPPFHRILLGGKPVADRVAGRLSSAVSRFQAGPSSLVRRLVVVGCFAAVCGGAVWFASTVSLSGDPRDMGYRDPEINRREALIRSLFPGLIGQSVVIASGSTSERALEINDELYGALIEGAFAADKIVSVSPFLPSPRAQQHALEAATELIDAETTRKAFLEAGFKPKFYDGLRAGVETAPLTPDDFADTSLAGLVSDSVRQEGDLYVVTTRVLTADDDELERLASVVDQVPGCSLVSERLQVRGALEAMQREIAAMLGIWLAVALVLVSLVMRSPLNGLRAALPAVFGVAAAAGLFGLLGRPLTPIAAPGFTLVMGLGIDYGIFMQGRRRAAVVEASPAVLASALTTLAAFGALAVARTRAMADLGLIIMVGVGAAVLAALVLVPALS